MAARSGERIKSVAVDGVEIIACPTCQASTESYNWGGCFHDDSIECINGHLSWHTFQTGDKIMMGNGIIMEYNGDDDEFYHQETKSNYKRWADQIIEAAKDFPE